MHETLEFSILEDDYNSTSEEIKKLAQELWDLKKWKRENSYDM
jgi:hypothetical protein